MGDQERRTTSAAGTKTNLEVVHTLCTLLDELSPRKDGQSYRQQITFVKDRPGHDQRYAIDASVWNASWDGGRPRLLKRVFAKRYCGICPIRTGWNESSMGLIESGFPNSIPPDSREFSVPFSEPSISEHQDKGEEPAALQIQCRPF